MADAFLAAGFSESEIRTMAVANTRRIAGLDGAAATVDDRASLAGERTRR
jgi:hypothetical protein